MRIERDKFPQVPRDRSLDQYDQVHILTKSVDPLELALWPLLSQPNRNEQAEVN